MSHLQVTLDSPLFAGNLRASARAERGVTPVVRRPLSPRTIDEIAVARHRKKLSWRENAALSSEIDTPSQIEPYEVVNGQSYQQHRPHAYERSSAQLANSATQGALRDERKSVNNTQPSWINNVVATQKPQEPSLSTSVTQASQDPWLSEANQAQEVKIRLDFRYQVQEWVSSAVQYMGKFLSALRRLRLRDVIAVLKDPKALLRRLTASQTALYVVAAGLVVFGVAVNLQGLSANRHVEAQVKQLQQSSSTSADTTNSTSSTANTSTVPSMEKPTTQAVASYVVAPNHVKYVDIPKLGVHARVVTVSVNKNNVLGAPTNGYDVGWYDGSALPGEKGATLLDAHSNVLGTPAVFTALKKLVAGDAVKITKGDGAVLNYHVVSVQTVKQEDVNMADMMVSSDAKKSGLNLITCGGAVIPGTLHLDSRTLVKTVID